MKFEKEISIEIFDDKKFKKQYDDAENIKKAVVTHYLHNFNTPLKAHFEKEAKQYIKQIVDYQNEVEKTNLDEKSVIKELLSQINNVPFPTPAKSDFTFIDLFAGIGGFRQSLQNSGGKCVFSSEWDKFAQITYRENFGEVPFGDITNEKIKSYIPNQFDVLCGGFPCQPFSHAGLKKGFEDTRGTLFFDVADIINKRAELGNPVKILFLENVKGLKNHDKGNTLKTIIRTLDELGYSIATEILNSKNFGLPQNRERIFIVAWLKEANREFRFPLGVDNNDKTIFEPEDILKVKKTNVSQILSDNPNPKYTISDKLFAGHVRRRKEHAIKGNGFGYSSFTAESVYTSTISARYYKDGSEILIEQEDKNPRKLTPREAANLQGYPVNYKIPVSDNQAYKQFGNSVSVPVIQSIFKEIKKQLL